MFMVVISVSLSGNELKQFDSITEKLGYSSRSDAVREAFQNFISQNSWSLRGEGSRNLLVSLMYDDDKAHRILDIVHDHTDIIYSSSHTHVEHRCIDQLVLKGDFEELNSFMNTISGVKDVRKQQYLI